METKKLKIGKNTCFEILDLKRIEESDPILLASDELIITQWFGRHACSCFLFKARRKRLEINCSSDCYRGWLLFSEDNIDDIDDKDDRDCAQFTINYINKLREAGIIGKQLSV